MPPLRWARRPVVVVAVAGQVRYEHGSAADLGTPERAAVLVHWDRTSRLSRSFTTLANELSSAGYRLVVVSAAEDPEPLEWGGRRPAGTLVLRKPNLGYDFGSWAVALHELPALKSAQRLILVNDSLLGPFSGISGLLAKFDASPTDVFGLTETRQYFPHLQSYFLGFSRGVMADAPLSEFFDRVRDERTKWDVINRYELGLSRMLRRESYSVSAAFRADQVVPDGQNPVIRGWWRLLEKGFPFVKREIMRSPELAPRGDWVAREVKAMFGENLEEWV